MYFLKEPRLSENRSMNESDSEWCNQSEHGNVNMHPYYSPWVEPGGQRRMQQSCRYSYAQPMANWHHWNNTDKAREQENKNEEEQCKGMDGQQTATMMPHLWEKNVVDYDDYLKGKVNCLEVPLPDLDQYLPPTYYSLDKDKNKYLQNYNSFSPDQNDTEDSKSSKDDFSPNQAEEPPREHFYNSSPSSRSTAGPLSPTTTMSHPEMINDYQDDSSDNLSVNVKLEYGMSPIEMDGEPFDPRLCHFSEDDLKPQPMLKKSKKQFVPDALKDEKYWVRRRKNNVAAKRSRDARRLKENQIALRARFLEAENRSLKQKLDKAKIELGAAKQNESGIINQVNILKERLSKYESV